MASSVQTMNSASFLSSAKLAKIILSISGSESSKNTMNKEGSFTVQLITDNCSMHDDLLKNPQEDWGLCSRYLRSLNWHPSG